MGHAISVKPAVTSASRPPFYRMLIRKKAQHGHEVIRTFDFASDLPRENGLVDNIDIGRVCTLWVASASPKADCAEPNIRHDEEFAGYKKLRNRSDCV